MYKILFLKECAFFLLVLQINYSLSDLTIPIGVIIENGDLTTIPVIKHAIDSALSNKSDNFLINLITEEVNFNNMSQLDRAICHFHENKVLAILGKPNTLVYQTLISYCRVFFVPILIPFHLEFSRVSYYVLSMQPQMLPVILGTLQLYKWKNIYYLYDNKNGPGNLPKFFHPSYNIYQNKLSGLFKVSYAEQANIYLRKLQKTEKHGKFYVILDTDTSLAKDILIGHAHDTHVKKRNFHFLLTNPVLEEFWETSEFMSINVTGFITSSPNTQFLEVYPRNQNKVLNLTKSDYLFFDTALHLVESIKILIHEYRSYYAKKRGPTECLGREASFPSIIIGDKFRRIISKKAYLENTLARKIRLDDFEVRNVITVIETSADGYKKIGNSSSAEMGQNGTQGHKKVFKIISLLSSPFLMMHSTDNDTKLEGNDRFKGFAKDLTELLAKRLNFDYEIVLPEDEIYGDYDKLKGQWTGLIGEIIRGKADIAITDLQITAPLEKVVDFLSEPICSTSLSILMKNPRYSSSTFYLLSSFSKEIWICIIIISITIMILFHVLLSFTGFPNSVESPADINDKKFTIISSIWFIIGSLMFHNTGIYPRSLSCRVLSGAWWCFTLVCFAFFIANTTTRFYVDHTDMKHHPQLSRLLSLSMESIIKESVENNWPHLGILRNSSAHKFIQTSSLPTYVSLSDYFQHYSNFMVDDINRGIQRIRNSMGNYAFIVESIKSDYYSNDGPCDLISIHDVLPYAEYGIAVPAGSYIRYDLNTALKFIKEEGELGHLLRKWWVDELKCESRNYDHQNLVALSSIFYIILIGLLIAGLACILQYFYKNYKGENRKQKLSTEDANIGQNLPSSELLTINPTEENDEIIDDRSEINLIPTSSSKESPHTDQES